MQFVSVTKKLLSNNIIRFIKKIFFKFISYIVFILCEDGVVGAAKFSPENKS